MLVCLPSALIVGHLVQRIDADSVPLQCCASYHHFPSIPETTRVLASFLKPGGSLLVADIKAEEDGRVIFPEVHHHLVPHTRGLSEETMREAFGRAGLVGFEMRRSFRAKMRSTGEYVRWFVARGVLPHSSWELDAGKSSMA